MGIIKKISSTNIVSKTTTYESKAIILKERSEGIIRQITITGVDENTVIREYIKSNDLYQTATFLVGSIGAEADWNDSTYDSIYVSGGTARTTWKKIDLGEVKDAILNAIILGGVTYPAVIYISISEDGVNWTDIASAGSSASHVTAEYKFRYLKIDYENSGTGGDTVKLYTLEIYSNEDDKCLDYKYLNDNKYIDYTVKTDKELYTVCIFTSNCNYVINDIDYTSVNYIYAEEVV